jgi:hypothetical protein
VAELFDVVEDDAGTGRDELRLDFEVPDEDEEDEEEPLGGVRAPDDVELDPLELEDEPLDFELEEPDELEEEPELVRDCVCSAKSGTFGIVGGGGGGGSTVRLEEDEPESPEPDPVLLEPELELELELAVFLGTTCARAIAGAASAIPSAIQINVRIAVLDMGHSRGPLAKDPSNRRILQFYGHSAST